LVDKPNLRKTHNIPVPLVGGVLVVISSMIALLIFPEVWDIEKKIFRKSLNFA